MIYFETDALGFDRRDFFCAKETGNKGQNKNSGENKDIIMSRKPFVMGFDTYEFEPKNIFRHFSKHLSRNDPQYL